MRYRMDAEFRIGVLRRRRNQSIRMAMERGANCWIWDNPNLTQKQRATLRASLDPEYAQRVQARIERERLKDYHRERRVRLAKPNWFDEWHEFVFSEAYRLKSARRTATGMQWDIDHMLPLRATHVSGLHVAENIQVIPGPLNWAKSNRMIYTEPRAWIAAL